MYAICIDTIAWTYVCYMYVWMHVLLYVLCGHAHTFAWTYVNTYIALYVNECIYILRTYIYTNVECMWVDAHIHVDMMYVSICYTNIYIHAYEHVCIHTSIHTHTCIQTYIHNAYAHKLKEWCIHAQRSSPTSNCLQPAILHVLIKPRGIQIHVTMTEHIIRGHMQSSIIP